MIELPFRHYDPTIARFMNPDPLAGLAPNWTPFRYGFNNPVLYNDPSGLMENNTIIIDWNAIPSDGGARWYNNDANNGQGHSWNFSYDEALELYKPNLWTRAQQKEYLEPIGLVGIDYGHGEFRATRASISSALRQIINNIENGYVQHGYRQGQWAFASGVDEHSMLRDVPALGGFINSYDWFAEGDIGRGVFYLGMGISDAFAVKALATSTGKFIIRQASKQIAKNIDNVVANTLTRFEMAAIKGAEASFDKMNLGESVITKAHHNWNKIFGDIKITLSNVRPYVDEALRTGKWNTTGTLRGKGGKVIGEKLELVQKVDGHDIWIGGMKTLDGKIIVNNAAVQ